MQYKISSARKDQYISLQKAFNCMMKKNKQTTWLQHIFEAQGWISNWKPSKCTGKTWRRNIENPLCAQCRHMSKHLHMERLRMLCVATSQRLEKDAALWATIKGTGSATWRAQAAGIDVIVNETLKPLHQQSHRKIVSRVPSNQMLGIKIFWRFIWKKKGRDEYFNFSYIIRIKTCF